MKHISVLFRCNAGHEYGYGHISRCLALAGAFKPLGATSVLFVLNSDEAANLVYAEGYVVRILEGRDQDAAFLAATEELKPDILILDARPPHSLAVLRKIKGHVRCLALIDDVSEQCLAADLVYLPPVPMVERTDWSGFAGQKRVGLQWMLTGRSFVPPPYRKPESPLRLLMTMGGSDPWGYTQRLAPFFAKLCREEGMQFGVVIGPGFQEREEQKVAVSRLPGSPRIFDAPAHMGEVYAWCDAAVVPMCVSAYELARSAKPALYICPDANYEEHARVFVREGFGEILPLGMPGDDAEKRDKALHFLHSFTSWSNLAVKAGATFPGDSAMSIAGDILRFLDDVDI
jgi:spore coat polysaccharide biosynthesis protein SpsF